jgi:hypothetical protein
MSETAGATTRAAPVKRRAPVRSPLVLVLALGFVLGCRLLLYLSLPERSSDFDLLYEGAVHLLRGENPYPTGLQGFPYPLPALLLAVPFTAIPLELARPVFDILVGWAFAFALWRYRSPYALFALLSGAYLFALANGQTTPLMVAAALAPALAFLLAVRPNTSAALWIGWPSWRGVLAVILFFGVSLAILPSWPRDWWMALPADNRGLAPLILRPFGFVLLLAGVRWRLPEARLILGSAVIPQTTLPYELVPLALIPTNRLEMGIYVAGTWIAMAAANRLHLGPITTDWPTVGWPATLVCVYVPMLYLVLRRRTSKAAARVTKERRRRHRLADDELKVEVSSDGADGVIVKVTHLPTRQFATGSGPNRKLAERKAQDKLAAIMAERSRPPETASG